MTAKNQFTPQELADVPLRRGRTRLARVPLTITLDVATYGFVESCAALKHFDSLDQFFDAALTIFERHIRALSAYVELQEAKGLSRDEIMRSAEWEILFTRHLS